MKLYDIRLCKKDEYEQLRDFICHYWSENHIFVRSKEIFEFQHGRADNGYYDFVVARHRDSGEFHAILGFIRSSLYEIESFDTPQAVYGAIWKVRDDVQNSERGKLGLGVLYYLIRLFPDSAYITLGLSHFSQDIYKMLHFNFGEMKHYYIANDLLKEYQIISRPLKKDKSGVCEGFEICRIDQLECIDTMENIYFPNKGLTYIKNRYLRHPKYQYEVLGIYKEETLVCAWVIRKINVKDASCIRIVDMIGNLEAVDYIYPAIENLLAEYDAEYIDCYNHGIPQEIFEHVGFHALNEYDDTVVPNYFERKNVTIHYAFYSKNPVVIFKGDADQDRPNL